VFEERLGMCGHATNKTQNHLTIDQKLLLYDLLQFDARIRSMDSQQASHFHCLTKQIDDELFLQQWLILLK
jgi:aminoglycoside phosphotransferase family enzyme